jgi:NDP-sugar pyrophosphorylase family protein
MSALGCSALMMAGGRSERMRSSGSATHKGLRMALGTPLIEWNLGALLAFSFKDIHIAVSSLEVELAEWVERRGRELANAAGASLALLIEQTALGTIGATGLLPAEVRDVLVVNVDNISDLHLTDLVESHLSTGAAATIATHQEPFRLPFGRLELARDRVEAYQEKPEIRVQISSGTYVLNRRAIDRLPRGQRADVPTLIQWLLSDGELVAPYHHKAQWIDVNDEGALSRAETMLSAEGKWPHRPYVGMAHG